MDIAARRSARQRNNFVMRLGCVLVSFSLVVSMMVTTAPRAQAFELTSGAIAALAGGFLNACGIAPVVSGMNNTDEVNNALARIIQNYLDSEFAGQSILEWAGDAVDLSVRGGDVVLPRILLEKFGDFAGWAASKYGTKPGVNVVYSSVSSFVMMANGSKFNLSTGYDAENRRFTFPGSSFPLPVGAAARYTFATGYSIFFNPNVGNGSGGIYYYAPGGSLLHSSAGLMNQKSMWPMYIGATVDGVYFMAPVLSTRTLFASFSTDFFDIGAVTTEEQSLALDLTDHWQSELDRIASLAEQAELALAIGATGTLDIAAVLQEILDRILAGTLSATITDVANPPVDPEEPDLPSPVVPVIPSGLDSLGAALTSRFPFSIPWDVSMAIELLVAPAKAPYFEVDLLGPIAHRVGGWKGDTRIVLDFSEYEIIGQVCRWASTVGFCLMLASGTKRLTWTA